MNRADGFEEKRDESEQDSPIREDREAQNFSQEKLAEIAHLSSTHIGDPERGERTPALETFVELAEVLDTAPQDLLVDLDIEMRPEEIKARIRNSLEAL